MADIGKILQGLGIGASALGGALVTNEEEKKRKKREEQQDLLFKLGLEDRERTIKRQELEDLRTAAELASTLLSESGTELGTSVPIAPAQGQRVASETIPLDTGPSGEITRTGDRVLQSISTQFGVDPKTLRTQTQPIAQLKTEAREKSIELSIQTEIDRTNAVYEGTSDIRQLQQDDEFKIWSRKNAIEHQQRMQAALASREGVSPIQLRNIVNDNMKGTANGIAIRLRQFVSGGGTQKRGVSLTSPQDWTQHIENRLRAIYGGEAMEGDISQEASQAVNNYHPEFEGKKPAAKSDISVEIQAEMDRLRAEGIFK